MRPLSPLLRSLIFALLACGCTLLEPKRDDIYGAGGSSGGLGGATGGSGGSAGSATGGTGGSPSACPLQANACVSEIHAGMSHTCALRRSDGAVFCWGHDETGAASGKPGTVVAQPTRVEGIPNAMRLATGSAETCILTGSGDAGASELWCWPSEDNTGPKQPLRLPNAQPFNDGVEVGVGDLSVSLLQANGAINTWVPGDDLTRKSPSQARTIEAGTDQSCAHDEDGYVSCWNFYAGSFPFEPKRLDELGKVTLLAGASTGEILIGTVENDAATIPTAARAPHCVVGDDGLVCFRGIAGTPEQRTIAPGTFVALAVGMLHGCVVLSNCSVACWGSNFRGQLGTNTGKDTSGFVDHPLTDVPNLTDVSSVAAGAEHSCALRRDGSIWCWGKNGDGQLGVPGPIETDFPVALDMSTICP